METNTITWDAGSFRDPAGSVFFYNQDVYRTLNGKDISEVSALLASEFFHNFVEAGTIIPTTLEKNIFSKQGNISSFVLKHEKIPFITYPYEWSFEMLKEAALLTLSILENALKEGFILKDGTAWNLTFNKGKMCFFDVLSIGKYQEGQTWEGYKQFCHEFLYPLMLKAYKDIDFQNIFKGSLSGLNAYFTNQLFSVSDLFKPGVFKHVFLNAKIGQQKTLEKASIRQQFKLPKAGLFKIIENLKGIIESLNTKSKTSVWHNYAAHNTYTDQDTNVKKEFIAKALKDLNSIIDIGCNTGEYSFLLADNAKIYSCDLDNDCIDQIFIKNKNERKNITPFVLDLMNPSANCGWKLQERKSIYERLQTDGFMALALIHHVCIASNVPLKQFIEFLSHIAPQGILEWVDKSDPMVQFLLRNREDIFDQYNWDNFYEILQQYFSVEQIKKINNGTRTLCFLKPLK